jgi:hypothetical protein
MDPRQEIDDLASQLENLAAIIRKAVTDGDLERCARLAATIQLTFREKIPEAQTNLVSHLLHECDDLRTKVDRLLVERDDLTKRARLAESTLEKRIENALLAVETAARKLREPVGYESGASSHELDEALARLDALRLFTPLIPEEGDTVVWSGVDHVARKCKGRTLCFTCDMLGYHLEPIGRCARCLGTGLVTAGGVSTDCPECSGSTGAKEPAKEPIKRLCSRCLGTGLVNPGGMAATCPECSGSRFSPRSP